MMSEDKQAVFDVLSNRNSASSNHLAFAKISFVLSMVEHTRLVQGVSKF